MLFKDERFGLFVHWGIYSVGKWHEQEQWRKLVPKSEYIKYMDMFNPEGYSPDEWISLAKEAGMQYVVFTTKHHDGFCMWDTKYTDYNVMNTPYGKDVLKEVAESCKKYGMKLGLYYSVPDWHYKHSVNFGASHQLLCPNPGDEPDEEKYKEYVKNQMSELLTNYGHIDALFWDIPPNNYDKSVNDYVRSLAPDIFINDRGYSEGDYSTPEREVPDGQGFSGLTEACQSVGNQAWGYRENEDYYSHKFIESAIDSIMARGGNYLLNVGPDAKGHISKEAKETLKEIGRWYKNVCESYLGAETIDIGIQKSVNDFVVTKKGNSIYLHLTQNSQVSGFALRPISTMPKKARVINNNKDLKCEIVYMPSYYSDFADFSKGTKDREYLHIMGVPVNELCGEVIVIELEFDDLDEMLLNIKEASSKRIL